MRPPTHHEAVTDVAAFVLPEGGVVNICPEWARCEYCGALSIDQTVEVQPGLLSHEGPGGAIHPVEADIKETP